MLCVSLASKQNPSRATVVFKAGIVMVTGSFRLGAVPWTTGVVASQSTAPSIDGTIQRDAPP